MAITVRFTSGWRACCQKRRLLKLSYVQEEGLFEGLR